MPTTEIVRVNGTQSVKLPDGYQFQGDTVSIRRDGEAVILEPLKPTPWPPGFFDSIRIDDPAFKRTEMEHSVKKPTRGTG
ncbi:MAG: hypothetical protein JNM56_02515 [Planctomycetia bacterium]|nr:hypothetical protein [Planctomycetia bacterium]